MNKRRRFKAKRRQRTNRVRSQSPARAVYAAFRLRTLENGVMVIQSAWREAPGFRHKTAWSVGPALEVATPSIAVQG
jgi:hypothetical protein